VVPVGSEQTRDVWVSFPPIAGGCGFLELYGVTFTDPTSVELTAPAEFPVLVGYGEAIALSVRFRPRRAGPWSATMTIDTAGGASVAPLIGVGLGRTSLPLILLQAGAAP